MKDVRNQIVNILKAEVKPALGCTEPVAVALACAKAKELLGEEIVKHNVLVSPNVYKNGMCVGIPGTERLGLKISVALGFIGGHSENGLRVLETLTEEEVKKAEEYMDTHPISISPADTKEKVYIEVNLEGKTRTSRVIIRTKHDNFVYLEENGNILLNEEGLEEIAVTTEKEENIMDTITIEELVKNVEALDLKDIEFLLEGIAMNEEIANYGLNQKVGIGVGYGIKKSMEDGLLGDDLMNQAMMITAAASDARMAGVKMPVMSSNGSGNHGLTAILPIVAYNKKFPQSDERLAKALAISHLVTAYIKNYTGRLSAVCGCGVAASTGATAGLSWLMSGDERQIEGAIENMVANLSGMICDGAKAGCALKLASAASAAVQSAIIAKQQCFVPPMNGIVGAKVEQSIQNLGRVSDKGMSVTDEVIINVMDDMNKVK
ncbi:L-serine ammonia-lyase, iron-sulfur-dependent, subunit alpha [Romboutsia sp. 1001216sp1]|uniref:L-cysteine desulfidase family protein n=1 Tax=unclassified Romboutsia TaxID=2626894 RepID=UPI00189F0471|nr:MULTISPECIES: L-serine ammonia-lyase, iron-sulfur-dependent, subunit alpha [unclassified Romboutsia]MDB8789224.1 L-serine ammonia-lyase, iron-sulfur-dependent, subunit alpha [Romboutsia sp. 1001216sp1]MDB8802200.1 L-serine ammonia-lyase, iron-sulfur-dependent, subunit alpha [Romboutsia sp. 1001216sp1]MDB8813597.1 L-serine ammonia-lyase, iron-sulfur-dependent, subunit alpha [Romboutsia sp. 1001216sp1]